MTHMTLFVKSAGLCHTFLSFLLCAGFRTDNYNYSNLEICAEEGELDKVDVGPGAGLRGGVQHIAAVRPNGSGTSNFHFWIF